MTKLLTLTTAVALTATTFGSVAKAQPADTTHISREPLFTASDAWIAAGFVVGTVAMYPADRYFARKLQSPGNQENRFLSNAATDFRFMGTPGSLLHRRRHVQRRPAGEGGSHGRPRASRHRGTLHRAGRSRIS